MKEQVQIESTAGRTQAYFVWPDDGKQHGGLILIHGIWALPGYVKEVTERFVAQGFVVLVPDLLLGIDAMEMVDQSTLLDITNPGICVEAQKMAGSVSGLIHSPQFFETIIQRLEGCFGFLKAHDICNGKVGVLGFCFGADHAYALAVREPELCAAVAFYSCALEPADKVMDINCPMLVFYNGMDERLVSQISKIKAVMKQHGKDYEVYSYPGTGHAFFNLTKDVGYNEKAVQDAWRTTLSFLVGCLN